MSLEEINEGTLPFVGNDMPFVDGSTSSGPPALYVVQTDLRNLPPGSMVEIQVQVRSADGGIRNVFDDFYTGPLPTPRIAERGPVLSSDGGFFIRWTQVVGTDVFDAPFSLWSLTP